MSALHDLLKKIGHQSNAATKAFSIRSPSNTKLSRIRITVLSVAILVALGTLWARLAHRHTINQNSVAIATVDQNLPNTESLATLIRQGQITQAIEQGEALVKLNPTDATLLANLGLAQKLKGDLASAEKSYEKALAANPTFDVVLNNLAMLRLEQNKADAAEKLLLKARSANSNNFDVVFNLAVTYERKLEWAKAVEQYELYLNSPQILVDNVRLINERIRRLSALSTFAQNRGLEP